MAHSETVVEEDLMKGLFARGQSSPELALAKKLTTPMPSK